MAVPVVGEQPYQLISFVPVQTIICKCTPGVMRFMMMFGIGNRIECGGCSRIYHIAGMNADGTCHIVTEMMPRDTGSVS
jgi:hypothetical protein